MSVEHEISQKVFVLTGAANGIGKATTMELLSHPQFLIYGVDSDHCALNNLPKSPRLVPTLFDVRKTKEIPDLVKRIHDEQGHIDGLINVAGVVNRGRRETYWKNGKLNDLGWDLLAVNFGGPLHFMDAVLPFMRGKQSGLIVNVTTTKYANSDPFSTLYEDSKALLSVATQNLRQQEAKNGITVIEVQPGVHYTHLDKKTWTVDSDIKDFKAAQFIYDFTRNNFGTNPVLAGEIISLIAKGKINQSRVLIGKDAHLAVFLHEHVPYWNQLFGLLYSSIFHIVRFALR